MRVSPLGTLRDGTPAAAASRRVLTAVLSACALLAVALAPASVEANASKRATTSMLKTKTKIAPKSTIAVRGTLRGAACSVRFPRASKSVRIRVTGPLIVPPAKNTKANRKKVKTKRLRVKKINRRSVRCTWNTRKHRDGRYRFTASAKLRYRGQWRSVSVKRSVAVRNGRLADADRPQLGTGNTRFVGRFDPRWDSWITNATPSQQNWLNRHMWGVSSFSSFFDAHTRWAPPTIAYKDLYAISRDDAQVLRDHPEWVLRDEHGKRLSIPWGCEPGPCPQLAGDIGNPDFRARWIEQARDVVSRGYSGLWIDDVNMEMRVGHATMEQTTPIDPRTGQLMRFEDWRRYVAEFLEEIKRSLPDAEIVANVLWFGGTGIGRDRDPHVQRAYRAVDRLNLERGFNDAGLTNGSEPRDIWSVDAFMAFIDRMHAIGKPVTLDSWSLTTPEWEYNLAGYFLVDEGSDALGEMTLTPGKWWSGWDVRLGRALGKRTRDSSGVFRRHFAQGLSLLNPPGGRRRTIKLGKTMRTVDGKVVSSVRLAPGRGAVLRDL